MTGVATPTQPLRRLARLSGCVVAVLVVDLLVVGFGFGAVLLTARRTSRLSWMLGVGGLVSVVVLALGLLVIPRVCRARRTMAGVAVVIACAALVATVLPARSEVPSEPASARYWDLASGSRLQYLHTPAQANAGARPPVIVLHGGPGIADLESDLAVFSPLSDQGYDVYAYAQAGAGGSSRLADPRGYGRSRDVQDLESIRRRLGVPRLVLIGHSYGAGLAAAYAARHPGRVAGLVLISPMPLDPADESPTYAKRRLTTRQALRVYGSVLPPRPLLAYLLVQVNPSAARAFMGDREADQRNDTVLAHSEPALHCADAPERRSTIRSGFYALQYPQSAGAPVLPDLRAALTAVDTPALIIKGACDYLSWNSAIDYRRALHNSSLLYLADAGHNAHQDRPTETLHAVRELLTGKPPSHRYDSPYPPADYEGPIGGAG